MSILANKIAQQYTVDSILSYVNKNKTNYAILLDGKWGIGKTYFWENKLKSKIEEIGKKTIYVSLYGVNNTEEIGKRIALGRWEIVQKLSDSKWGGRITELAKATFGSLKNIEIQNIKGIEVPKINFEKFIDFTQTVLCFDDLERANIDINEILGYINNFVEHDGTKVIIIGNEDEIADKLSNQNLELKVLTSYFYLEESGELNRKNTQPQNKEQVSIDDLITNKVRELFHKRNEYKRIKEKLIGKTLTIQLDERSIIEDIIDQTSNQKQELQKFLEHNIHIIETTFKESDTKNIRILKQGLEDFELIYQQCIEIDSDKLNVMLQSILKFVLAASFEIKTNSSNSEELGGINSYNDFIEAGFLRGLDKERKGILKQFEEKYYKVQTQYYHRKFFKFAEVLIRKGIFNKELFKEEMASFQLSLEEKKNLHEELLRGEFWGLSDDEFIKIEQETYKKLIEGEVNFAWYFRAYKIYSYFIENKMVSNDNKNLKEELMIGLNKASENGKSIDYLGALFYHEKGIDEDKNLLEFKEEIIKINKTLRSKEEKIAVEKIMDAMKEKTHQSNWMLNYFHAPFFVHCDIEELSQILIGLTGDQINSFRMLVEKRVSGLNELPQLKIDLENLKLLKQMLNDQINHERMTPRLVSLKELIGSIEKFEYQVSIMEKTNE
ncbi:P-loop NTPase fold protein [Bacillus pacificus]|uniref:P-loop NTPase fold protein n=1 Tax=Bacillus pacificus TaxID=2026187 RepID=UPI003D22B96A